MVLQWFKSLVKQPRSVNGSGHCQQKKNTMSDRTSAALFGEIFELLAENPDDRMKEIAASIWPKRTDFDFNEYQMGCDAALIRLGLAKMVPDDESDDPDEVETIRYKD